MSIKEYLGLMGRPPIPAGGGDAWGQGIASGVQAFLASQPTLADQQKMRMERDFYDARTGLVREQTRAAQTEAALKALGLQTEQKKQSALQDYIQRHVAVDRQEAPGFVGPADPSLTRPTTWEGALTGMNPDDLTQMSILAEAMRPQPSDSRMRTLAVASGKPVGVEQAVSSAELDRAQQIKQRQQDMQLQGNLARAQATERAAQIRGPSGGGASPWKIETVTGPDGTPIMMRVNPQTGQAEPFTGPGGTPLAGKRKDLTAPIQKTLGEYGDQYTALGALKANFKDEYAGQPMTGKAWNWVGRTFGDEGQAQFWQTSDALDMAVRNKMFGAALTAHEQRLWDAASINPGMDPKQIRENINRRIAILEGASRRRIAAYERNGFDRSQMEMLSGLTPVEGDPTAVNRPQQPGGAPGNDPMGLR